MQTLAGIFNDYFGPKILLTIGAFVCGCGCFLFSHASSFGYAEIGRILMGGGLSFAFVCLLGVTGTSFPMVDL